MGSATRNSVGTLKNFERKLFPTSHLCPCRYEVVSGCSFAFLLAGVFLLCFLPRLSESPLSRTSTKIRKSH